ncbi:hypothetical protein AC578_6563 [Pseudocercospora eumusae]|uniref:Uncharacterized protein n=1 Tax=Pseudocercospora eumusae TaxID=321146 RepID=A0A139HI03_9PEZI|nr:hypothetical protein AC578_6563 [Pseudocercospora eumusae]
MNNNLSTLTRLPGEIRNMVYDLTVPSKEIYTLQYPRATGASDLISSPIFELERQIRHEALTYHYPDSKILIEPRPGFFLQKLPRCLNDLPFDVLKVAKEIEVKTQLLPPFAGTGAPSGDLLKLSFTVSAEGFYATSAYYRSTSQPQGGAGLRRAQIGAFVQEQIEDKRRRKFASESGGGLFLASPFAKGYEEGALDFLIVGNG